MNSRRLRFLLSGFLALLLIVVFLWWHGSRKNFQVTADQQNYDVVVVGAGPGGVAASLQAARMGMHVALLEPTDWIGGQMTAAAVGTMDEGDNNAARKSGIYAEFVKAVTTYYGNRGHSTGTCYYYQDSLCVDPRDGQRILKQMLRSQSKNLDVLTGKPVSAVLKNGNTVTGVISQGVHYNAKVVIDADEYGDILEKAGAAFRLGTGISDGTSVQESKLNTSNSDLKNSCLQGITYSAVMKYYPTGVPKGLRFTKAPPNYTAAIQKHFQKVISQGSADYSQTKNYPTNYQSYTAWRGYPDLSNPHNYNVLQQGQDITRTALNLGNDSPLNSKLGTAFISDPSVRLRNTCQAKLLTLQLAYFIQHDLGQTNWAIANDEGYNTVYNREHHCPSLADFVQMEDQMPQEPYVREGRRLVGVQTLTGADLYRRPWSADNPMPTYNNSIAVGYYKMDLHGCNQAEDLESGLDTATYLTKNHIGPFEVPLGVLIPQSVDGLLAAEKNISVSRLAEGAIREQPIAMGTGQAAGALAALAVKRHEQPRAVPATEVQTALKQANVIISAH